MPHENEPPDLLGDSVPGIGELLFTQAKNMMARIIQVDHPLESFPDAKF
jgi:hypothetical protein